MTHQEREKLFEERIAKRKMEEEAKDAAKAEQLRQAYLKRTGRTELKP